MIRAIIFDCFGVVVTEGWYAFRAAHLKDAQARQAANDIHQATNRGMLPYETFERELSALAKVSIDTVRSFLDNNADNEPLLTYIKTDLKPKYRIGMLSNAADDWLDTMLSPEQRALFDEVVLSYQIRATKPERQAYEAAAKKLGVLPEECVFIDDTERFCTAARECGMQAIWFQETEQCISDLEAILANAKD